jgi:hypothetical protein
MLFRYEMKLIDRLRNYKLMYKEVFEKYHDSIFLHIAKTHNYIAKNEMVKFL